MRHITDKRLIVAYDDESWNHILKNILSVLGYDVLTAASIKEIKEKILKHQPEVIVTDLMFEDYVTASKSDYFKNVDGFLDFLEENLPDTKVVFFTAFQDPEFEKRFKSRLYSIHYKPSGMDEITASIGKAFGIKKAEGGEAMTVQPIWHGRGHSIKEDLCFVLMPFSTSWSDRIWKKHLIPIIESCGFKVMRGDDFIGHDIMEDIWKGLNEARIIIADITGKNPNVFYELGIAHTLGKDIILITQDMKAIPFDVNRYRIIKYEDNSDGYEKLEKHLAKFFSAIS